MSDASKPQADDNEMPAEIDSSSGVRGKFYRPNAKLDLPVYPDQDVR